MAGREKRRALVLLGMPGSGTATLAALLGAMGCDLVRARVTGAGADAQASSDAGRIGALNDELLASADLAAFDQSPVSASWLHSAAARAFAARAQTVLAEEFGQSPLFVIDDPRIGRLLPFWDAALAGFGAEPAFVFVHRDPAADAAALAARGTCEPLTAGMLSLNGLLEAERDSRGKRRVFASHEQIVGDIGPLIDRIARQLDLIFPRAIADVAADAARLIAAQPGAPAAGGIGLDRLEGGAASIEAASAILNRWALSGEDVADHVALDAVRMSVEAATGTLDPILAKLAARDHDSPHVPTRPPTQQDRRSPDLLAERLAAAETALAAARRSLAAVTEAAAAQTARERELTEGFNERTQELVRARRRPIRNLRRYLELKALKALSASASPLPRKTKSRLARSAAKRDPKHYLIESLAPIVAVPQAIDEVEVLRGGLPHRAGRPVVVIVSHEASRSGAPILALNLAEAYAERYNIVMLSLRGGELVGAFQAASTALYVTRQPSGSAEHLAPMLDALCEATPPLFAVVNCIESRPLLRAFSERGIPTVGLFHEFASNILPKTAFSEAFRSADQIVFSTELTLANALDTTFSVRTERFHVLPQGRCELPGGTQSDAARLKERDRLTAALQPNGPGEFLVLGAGYVQMRKGVDLFIDVARRVLSTAAGRSARFAWIGPLYDPERDAGYSVYLKDQIERAGLRDRMTMVSETSEIGHAYALSRVLLLTSRLDPLPNVAIDAMSEGLPVICFDKTTGIADLLVEAGLGPACVADYLDTEQAAARLLDLIRSPDRYRAVADTTRAFAAVRFDAEAYAREIEGLALAARSAREHLDADRATIAAADAFDPGFMLPGHRSASTRDAAALFYLTDNKREPEPRRPEPGFNPLVFASTSADVAPARDAYAEFLRRGRPEGVWLRRVIGPSDAAGDSTSHPAIRAALHIHAYYPDVLPVIVERLAINRSRPDIFVSAADPASLDAAVKRLEGSGARIADARVTVNRGRDLGPLLTAFGPLLVRDYDLIGHVHTKKSAALGDRALVERWVRFLYENVLGGDQGGAMMDRIIAAFAGDERLGIVFPADPNLLGWSGNEPIARDLAVRLRLGALPGHFDFPVGSMFWVRSEALEPLVAMGLEWTDYPLEPAAYDGTILHAIERLFGIVPERRGLNVAVTHVNGVTR